MKSKDVGLKISTFTKEKGLEDPWTSAKAVTGTQNIHCVSVLSSKCTFDMLSKSHTGADSDSDPPQATDLHASNPVPPVANVDLIVAGSTYAAVVYDDVWWPGLVQKVVGDIATISFMTPKSQNKFQWPRRSQIETVRCDEILTILQSPPEPVNQRGFFSFPPCEVDRVEKLLSHILDKN